MVERLNERRQEMTTIQKQSLRTKLETTFDNEKHDQEIDANANLICLSEEKKYYTTNNFSL